MGYRVPPLPALSPQMAAAEFEGLFFPIDAKPLPQPIDKLSAFHENPLATNFKQGKDWDSRSATTLALLGVDERGESMAVLLENVWPTLRFLMPVGSTVGAGEVLKELAGRVPNNEKLLEELTQHNVDFQTYDHFCNGFEYEGTPGDPCKRQRRRVYAIRLCRYAHWQRLRAAAKKLAGDPLACGAEPTETWLEPEQDVYAELGIAPGGWTRVKGRRVAGGAQKTLSVIEVHCTFGQPGVLRPDDVADRPQPPLKAISFDIETSSYKPGAFPVAHIDKCRVATIAATVLHVGGGCT